MNMGVSSAAGSASQSASANRTQEVIQSPAPEQSKWRRVWTWVKRIAKVIARND